ncbi:MAG TPA: tetratricopeptide repeat protein [Rhizomicrobium sp.]
MIRQEQSVRGLQSAVVVFAIMLENLGGCAGLEPDDPGVVPVPQNLCAVAPSASSETMPNDAAASSWNPPLTFSDGTAAYGRGDYQLAVAAWRPLAAKGDAKAENGLGVLYEYGRGIPQDPVQASHWLRRAVSHGSAQAGDNLGWMYERGFGVQADKVCAYMWYSEAAAAAQDDDAGKMPQGNLARLGPTLKPDEITRARAIADDCRKSNFQACS